MLLVVLRMLLQMLLLWLRLLHVRLVQIAEASPRLEVPPSSSISAVVMIHCRLLHVKVLRSRRTVRLGRHVEVLKVMRGPRRRRVAALDRGVHRRHGPGMVALLEIYWTLDGRG